MDSPLLRCHPPSWTCSGICHPTYTLTSVFNRVTGLYAMIKLLKLEDNQEFYHFVMQFLLCHRFYETFAKTSTTGTDRSGSGGRIETARPAARFSRCASVIRWLTPDGTHTWTGTTSATEADGTRMPVCLLACLPACLFTILPTDRTWHASKVAF